MQYKAAVLGSLLLVSGSVFGGEGETTLNIGGGVMTFDNDRLLDDGTVGTLGLEYGITDHIAVELSGLTTSPDFDEVDGHADVSEVRLDGIYYLLTDGRILPYLAAGAGRGEFDSDYGDYHETQYNLGGGARIAVNDIFSVRLDLRGIHGNQDNDKDSVFTVGLSWTFGGANAPASVAPAPRVPAVKPKVVEQKPLDSDGDGVYDRADKCPGTPANVAVEADGCVKKVVKPAAVEAPVEKAVVETITLNIEFSSNSSIVESRFSGELEKVASFLKRHKDVTVVIEGHSDSRGKDSYNKSLSQRRADAVKSSIVKQFAISDTRIQAVGYGEEKPIASNDTADGRQKNRRVVAVMKK